MSKSWCNEELETNRLGDQRLDKRLSALLEALAAQPNASLPQALGARAELQAAYRFFNNDKVTPLKILRPHVEATAKRCAAQKVVFVAQDTTELDLTHPQMRVQGAGPLDGSSRCGAFLHASEAFTEEGTPLGAVAAKIWARETPDPAKPALSSAEKGKKRRALPVEEKESMRWIEGARAAQALAKACPETLCVSLCDSEGDFYDLLAEPRAVENFHWIVRACQERAVLDTDGRACGAPRDLLLKQPVLATHEIVVRGREPLVSCETRPRRMARTSRRAVLEVRACPVTLKAPAGRAGHGGGLAVQAVMAREAAPAEGEEPVEWILLTTLPASTAEEALRVLRGYTVRWSIEVWFRVLKSGCRVEARRFESLARLVSCVAVYMIVAWRTLLACRLGRDCPDMDCTVLFEDSEWQCVWTVTHRGAALPAKVPRLSEMVEWVARLGGYVSRGAGKSPPGVETVWKGLQRMHDLSLGWVAAGGSGRAHA
jgi:hypothetical protein